MKHIKLVRGAMALQAAIFLVAVSIHFGLLFPGYGHRAAGTAESIIALVLIAGLVMTFALPSRARVAAIATQSFGILGVLVGLFTIAVGVGPRTSLDLALHGLMLIALVGGLIIAVQTKNRAVTA
jgi:heme A synthase